MDQKITHTDRPSEEALYAAFVARDPSLDGRVWVGVSSTGIFCRPTCPTRKPKPQNCQWFQSPAEALAAGFRPCRRCHPLSPEVEGDPVVQDLLAALHADPSHRWTEADLVARNLDPSSVRRKFQRHFGRSFLDLARDARLRCGVARLQAGGPVIEAQLDAGFDSASGFRDAFTRLFGHAPLAMRGDGDGLVADWLETPLGGMIAVGDGAALHLLEFTDRKALGEGLQRLSSIVGGRIGLGRSAVIDQAEEALNDYFAARSARFDFPLALLGTAFEREVWDALRAIPPGQTVSYAALAASIGRPRATRAVARANARNRLAIVIPCHRVIGADGSLTGYSGGLWRKQALIEIETRLAQTNADRSSPSSR